MISTILRRLSLIALTLALTAATSPASYYFLHYATRTGPFVPIPEKFDVNALPDKTVSLFVSDLGPTQMVPGDSFASVVSQIRLAARTWNDVETSDLRVAFGGLFSPGTQQSTPHVEVVFDDVPGVLAKCGPMVPTRDPVMGPNGPFLPITTSTCILNQDLTQPSPRPSSGEAFFLTVVHELGHALGLQHTVTSSAMSIEVTRATTRATPLANDDIAGISALYPTAKFMAQSGSISGQVMMDGQGVHMASVVALMPDRPAFSAITHPDGTYKIDGLPSGQYYVYVTALPPAQQGDPGPAGNVIPLGPDQQPILPGDPFETQFYPGTRDLQQAGTVAVAAGSITANVNFTVNRRGPNQIYGITTYSFPGQIAVKPAFLSPNGTRTLMAISTGAPLTVNDAPAPGLSVSVLGNTASVQQIRAYPPAPQYLQVDFSLTAPTPGPRHLVFMLNNEIYVLPSAFQVATNPPPFLASVIPGYDSSGNRAAIVVGGNLMPDTRILFDGFATSRTPDPVPGGFMVYAPPGAANYQANVVALNSDGQSSLFIQPPVPYFYDGQDQPSIALSQNTLPAGSEAMIEIVGVNTNFVDGQTRIGFGSSDIAVRRIWVMSPTRMRAQVSVSPWAPPVASLVSVMSGFQVISQPFAFQVQPSNPLLPVIDPHLLNPATGQPGVTPGSPAVLLVSNLPPGNVSVLLNDVPVSASVGGAGQLDLAIPANFPPGPAVLRLQVGGSDVTYPVLVAVEAFPPQIGAVLLNGLVVDGNRPAKAGDYLTIIVAGLAEPGVAIMPARVRVNAGGVEHQAMFVAAFPGSNIHQVLFALSPQVPTGQQAVTVTLDDRTSAPFPIMVRGQ